MKFLIDGHRDRVALRYLQWPEGVAGQLLTPLTRYSRGHEVFAIDNGCFTSFREQNFKALLKREFYVKDQSLFVCVPDKVGSHKETMVLWDQYSNLANGYKKAFVAQEGYEGFPEGASALFIGGTNTFKDSKESENAVKDALAKGLHVHIGRVNGPERFIRFHLLGAHTCDGSGVSRYDHMLPLIRDAIGQL
jgi:hypothetical protein